jgi:hypothetical protein
VRKKALARDSKLAGKTRAGFSILKPRRAKELGYMTEKEQEELKEEKEPKEAKEKKEPKEAKEKKEAKGKKEPKKAKKKKEAKGKKEPEEPKEPEELEEPKEPEEPEELEEVALGLEGIVGVHAMNKSELLAAVKKAKGIVDDKKRQTSVDVRTIKGKIRELRSQKEAMKEAGDKKKIKILRRRINRLKKKTRRAAMA